MRRRLFLDLNVVLDVLLERTPHVAVAAALWARIEKGAGEGFLPAHGLTTIHCLARRARGASFARRTVVELLSVFRVAPVDERVIRQALTLERPDFEDAVCAACAVAANCEALVTRDPAGFRGVPIPVIDPATAMALLSEPSAS